MGINFDGFDAFVSEKFPNLPEVGSGFQQLVDITSLGYLVFRNPEIPTFRLQS